MNLGRLGRILSQRQGKHAAKNKTNNRMEGSEGSDGSDGSETQRRGGGCGARNVPVTARRQGEMLGHVYVGKRASKKRMTEVWSRV